MSADLRLGDCMNVMRTIPNDSIDLVITSPPYNVGVDYGNKGKDADKKPLCQYKAFADGVMWLMYPLLKHGGRVCFEIGGSGRDFPLSWVWQDAAYKAGFNLFSEIAMQHRKTNQTAWGSWLKADSVYTVPNFHMLYVFYKGSSKKEGGITTIDKKQFIEWTRGYWQINWSIGSTKEHPAQFPVELPYRCLSLFGHKGDMVLDPFSGSGTTGIACVQNERDYIGIELDEYYYNLSQKRINLIQQQIRMEI